MTKYSLNNIKERSNLIDIENSETHSSKWCPVTSINC